MKFRNLSVVVATTVVALLLFIRCEDQSAYVRIKRMQWENVWYKLVYSPSGRLVRMVGQDSKISLFYDENNKLYRAEFKIPGCVGPTLIQTFTQGEFGIEEAVLEKDGVVIQRDYIEYSSSGLVLSVQITSGELTQNHPILLATFSGGNLVKLAEDYEYDPYPPLYYVNYSFGYDNKISPFSMLAESVGNPAFFPLGRFWFYPMGNPTNPEWYEETMLGGPYGYELQYLARFSKNNPTNTYYVLLGTDVGSTSDYEYTYSGPYVTSIVWIDAYITSPEWWRSKEKYAFEYEQCVRRSP